MGKTRLPERQKDSQVTSSLTLVQAVRLFAWMLGRLAVILPAHTLAALSYAMRNTIRYLFWLFLLPACQPKPVEHAGQPLPAATLPVAAAGPMVAQRFSPIISGYWVSARYLAALARTRSPKAAIQDFPNYPVTILVEPAAATADSTHASLVLNLHEGSDMTIFFRPGSSTTSLPARTLLDEVTISYEVTYQASAADTVLYVVKRQHQRELSRFAYRRVARVRAGQDYTAQLNDELAHLLNRQLVAGSYAGTDSLGRPLRVQLSPTGQVKGLPFRTYHVLEDFLGGPTGGDALIFNTYQKNQEQFEATYGRDTIRLYAQYEAMGLPPGATDSLLAVKRGRLRYQLVRLRKP